MIDWNKIELKGRTSGNFTTLCPECSHTRKKKKDPCLSINLDKGVGKCHHCQEVTIRETKEIKEYKLPPQKWQNYTKLSDNLVKWFKNERNISQQTLIDCKITEEEYFQPAAGKKLNNIVFNYFEGDKLINKKYRSGSKQFTQTAQTKKLFYGVNDIVGEKEIYLVEGEMDKLAFWEVGIKNCISVPNGANDLNDIFDTCEKYISDLEKIYIAVDTDEAGKKLERELLKRFGKWKCERIEFTGKDANDSLKISKVELLDNIKNSIAYPVDGTFTAKDIEEDIFDYFDNGIESTIAPNNPNFKELNSKFSVMMGQLTTVTGIPSHGKSNFIEWYVLNLINDLDLKASFYSPEHFPLKLHQGAMSEKVIGKSFNESKYSERMSKNELKDYIEWSKDKVYLTYPEKGEVATWEWLLGKFKEQMFRFGIDIFVIDAFNKVKRNSPDSLGEINDVLSTLTLFAQAYDVHIFLIAHPTKMRKNDSGVYEMPTLYDVKGSGDFRDQTHNGICVYRNFEIKDENGMILQEGSTVVTNLKTKFKHQGMIGESVKFRFNMQNNRYYPYHYKLSNSSLIHDNKEQQTEIQDSSFSKPIQADWLTEEEDFDKYF